MTIAEIAALAGVSRGTVDRVVNNRGSVDPEKQKRILEIIEQSGFVPNKAGKTLAVRKKNLKFGFVLFNSTNNPFFLDVERGIDSFVRDYGAYGIQVLREYSSISDSSSQIAAIDRLVANGICALAITPMDDAMVKDRLLALQKEGIPVVTVNSDLPESGRMAYVGSDYYRSGQTAAGIMGLATGSQGKIAIVIGSDSILCHTERERGFRERVKEAFPNMSILTTVQNSDDDLCSYLVVKELLAQGNISAIYLAAAGTEGALKAIKESQRAVTVISHDSNPVVASALEEGLIVASIFQSPFEQGRKPLKMLFEKLGFGTEPEKVLNYTKSEIIIRENLEQFLEKEIQKEDE